MKQSGISPKVIAAVIAAVVGYVIGQDVADIPNWVVLVGQAILVGIAAYFAPPGTVVSKDGTPNVPTEP